MNNRHTGFTLVELMVVVAIVAIGASLAAPSFRTQLASYSVRTGAEGIVNGLQLARTEAVRRNASVDFELTNTAGAAWVVRRNGSSAPIQSRSAAESAALSASATGGTTVTFLSTGMVKAETTRLTQVDLSSSVSGTDRRRVVVIGGGLIHMCDPNNSIANDPRGC